MNYEIPTEYECLWRYLGNAYDTDAMKQSTPADREIISHYLGKVQSAPESRKNKVRSTLMQEARTLSVPEAGGAKLNGDMEQVQQQVQE